MGTTQRVLTVTLPILGRGWSAEFAPIDPNVARVTAQGYGSEWIDHLTHREWEPAEGAVLIDFRPADHDISVTALPITDPRLERGTVKRFGTGPAWNCPVEIDPIDWDAGDFDCGGLDAVHPLDYAEMLKKLGVCVIPLMDALEG